MTGEINISVRITDEDKKRIKEAKQVMDEIYMALAKITSDCDCMSGLNNAIGYLDMILEGKPVY